MTQVCDPYRPDESSPLLNAGVNLFTNYGINPGTVDFFGSPISTSGPWSIGIAAMKSALKSVILNTPGDGSWPVPADFAALFAVDVVPGGASANGSAGAGAGAFARSFMQGAAASWVAGTTTVPYHVAASVTSGNGDNSSFGALTLAAAQSLGKSFACAADGGKTNSGLTGGLGGLAVNSVGDIVFNGGNGGNNSGSFNGGGGGAAGLFGPGGNGSNGGAAGAGPGAGGGANGGRDGFLGASLVGGQGGTGPFGTAGGAGSLTNGTAGTQGAGGGGAGNSGGAGGAGGAGIDWIVGGVSYGPGGGGGANAGSNTATNVGANFGGSVGGRSVSPASGQGGIRVLYKTVASL
jgi:hypothetical protein